MLIRKLFQWFYIHLCRFYDDYKVFLFIEITETETKWVQFIDLNKKNRYSSDKFSIKRELQKRNRFLQHKILFFLNLCSLDHFEGIRAYSVK